MQKPHCGANPPACLQDFFFRCYADAVAQAVLYAMFLAYPKSRIDFTEKFRKDWGARRGWIFNGNFRILHRPKIYGRYLQFRFLTWPLIFGCFQARSRSATAPRSSCNTGNIFCSSSRAPAADLNESWPDGHFSYLYVRPICKAYM